MTTFTRTETQEHACTVDGHDGILTIRSAGTHRSWNGIQSKTGMHARNASR